MKLLQKVSSLLLLSLALAGAAAEELPAEVRAAVQRAGLSPEEFHAAAVPLGPGGSGLGWNDRQPVPPASVFKILTTAAALDRYGPAASWKTVFYVPAGPDSRGSVGALYIRASGAPWLPVPAFREALLKLRWLGVRSIDGPVVVDRSVFAEPPVDPSAFDGRPDRPYNQGPDALALALQSLSFTFVPDEASGQARVIADFSLAGYSTPAAVALDAGSPCPSNIGTALRPRSNGGGLSFEGSYPAACGAQTWSMVPFPEASADRFDEALFRSLWSEAGGSWTGRLSTGRIPEGQRELLSLSSESLADLIKATNKGSINPMARSLFLLLSADEPGGATLRASRQRLLSWLEGLGIDTAGLVPDNGSGLSRRTRASARQIALALAAEYRSPWGPEFMSSLPIAGLDGTMRRRPVPAGTARIKTGYLSGVRSAAGYVRSRSGMLYALCAVIDSPRAAEGRPAIDAFLAYFASGRADQEAPRFSAAASASGVSSSGSTSTRPSLEITR
ncbi:MAG: D-alanyl-D-alanine carboxypeptidase/D-alanyl-D-alanine-endopeptidase [Mesosutterella sp.]|nr:D-alanyl-D-alanine carboxypeptidase/D-alanyl-D-alanine-endopeptidase [Mesosutterella sp.]